jgi:superoxide reductase
MKQNEYHTQALILLVALFLLLPAGCSRSQEEPAEQSMEAASEAAAEPAPAEQTVFTREDPGAYGGKEDSHVPRVAYEKTESGLRVTVSVSHEMNAEKPHYIMWIQLKDGEGNTLGEKQFQASDEEAAALFELTTVPEKLVAFEKCNLHGLWKEEVAVI